LLCISLYNPLNKDEKSFNKLDEAQTINIYISLENPHSFLEEIKRRNNNIQIIFQLKRVTQPINTETNSQNKLTTARGDGRSAAFVPLCAFLHFMIPHHILLRGLHLPNDQDIEWVLNIKDRERSDRCKLPHRWLENCPEFRFTTKEVATADERYQGQSGEILIAFHAYDA
ncbi:MAG: hypothetical protein JW807_12390, partial [Spirochaetes bacterium]|nr:hypothetical protein [Spirochaetota bacterium]